MTGSTNEALADACSGVVGTLVSLWCFYPIERLKTNVQAGTSTGSFSSSSFSSPASALSSTEEILEVLKRSFRGCGTKSLHATASSFCYFYFYSWIVSDYQRRRRRKTNEKGDLQKGTGEGRGRGQGLAPSTRLFLAAIAAMLNTLVTLPLDVLSSQRTVGADPESNRDATTKAANRRTAAAFGPSDAGKTSHGNESAALAPPSGSSSSSSFSSSSSSPTTTPSEPSVVELVFHEACSCSEDLFSLDGKTNSRSNSRSNSNSNGSGEHCGEQDDANNTSRCSNNSSLSGASSMLSINEEYRTRWNQRQLERNALKTRRRRLPHRIEPRLSVWPVLRASLAKARPVPALPKRWSGLWKGLAPALLLCSNPSIHYTVFDVLKNNLLAWKRQRKNTVGGGGSRQQLSASDAFVLGLLSKFVATIVTYPLIRAKVLMMVQGNNNNNNNNGDDDDDDGTGKESTGRTSKARRFVSSRSSSSLLSVLEESYHRDGGIKGLYKGCDWQLIHTLLKSALMMAIREKITGTSRSLFRVGEAASPSSS